jgi:hypothetical protein
MRDKLIRKASVWVLCAVVVGCLGYSMLVLTARPAYGGTVCEPEDCTLVTQQIGPGFCAVEGRGGFRGAVCPDNPNYPDVFIVYCRNGEMLQGDCSTF